MPVVFDQSISSSLSEVQFGRTPAAVEPGVALANAWMPTATIPSVPELEVLEGSVKLPGNSLQSVLAELTHPRETRSQEAPSGKLLFLAA